jgi:tRNA pseudouridine55 synthase
MNGLIVIDKPGGMTSHDVVNIVRRATGERSVGHLGTLDPMATGVLPLLLGKYTRLAQFFGAAEKSYEGTIRFGYATDTFDAEGSAAGEEKPLALGLAELRSLAAGFHGEMEQMPPVFSAKKIGGVPAHKLARQGKDVPVKAARITIHHFELLSLDGNTAAFAMSVSAGGYVRSVAHELGQLAGCGAHLASLRRTQAGDFTLAEAITIEELKKLSAQNVEARLVSARSLLPQMAAVWIQERDAGALRNGMQVNLPEYSGAPLLKALNREGELVAILRRIAGTLMQPVMVVSSDGSEK